MNPITKAWLESAEIDLGCIEQIINEAHLTPAVAFHSQQAIEKSFKAILESYRYKIARTHNLIKLYDAVCECISFEVEPLMLTAINDVYIDSRYPGDLGLLPDGKPSLADARQFYEFANDIFIRVNQALKS